MRSIKHGDKCKCAGCRYAPTDQGGLLAGGEGECTIDGSPAKAISLEWVVNIKDGSFWVVNYSYRGEKLHTTLSDWNSRVRISNEAAWESSPPGLSGKRMGSLARLIEALFAITTAQAVTRPQALQEVIDELPESEAAMVRVIERAITGITPE